MEGDDTEHSWFVCSERAFVADNDWSVPSETDESILNQNERRATDASISDNGELADEFESDSYDSVAESSDDLTGGEDYSRFVTSSILVNRSLEALTSRELKLKQHEYVTALRKLGDEHGMRHLALWVNQRTRYKNGLLHTFVLKSLTEVVRFLLEEVGCDINSQRTGDGSTACHLACFFQKKNIVLLLLRHNPDLTLCDHKNVPAAVIKAVEEKFYNIAWVDLELTDLPEVLFDDENEKPEVLECAVIITDRNLVELGRGSWVIHHEKERLEKLSDWHQRHFCSRENNGNGLFEDVLQSKLTREQFEEQFLALVSKHCVKGVAPMAGNSVHTDRTVFLLSYENLYRFFSHRIIDVSTIQELAQRWSPGLIDPVEQQRIEEAKVQAQCKERHSGDGACSNDNRENNQNSHRAMGDIERSIELLKHYRQNFHRLVENSSK